MTSQNVLDRFGPKETYEPMTLEKTRERFLEGYHHAVAALKDGHFMDAQRRGWLTVKAEKTNGSLKFLIRPGYGDNNQWVRNTDLRLRPGRWIKCTSIGDALEMLDALFELAQSGHWDDGLKRIFKRNQEMVEKRKPKLDAYRAKDFNANTLAKYGMEANENVSESTSDTAETVSVPLLDRILGKSQ